ncbi:MAG TPA: tyrosine-type recombinase/integrase [Candidatus Paceibacterota bacterium]|nr:tyrosine-type recombinase/integrase [Candidatus Paceibacterota bacterium]HRZ54005.1 tyrosine-type recombinase/integrase [Candidatus Paceibacterota bacterium]
MKVRRTLRHGKTVWELDTGVIEGKRRRLFFRTEKAARLRLSEIESDFHAAGRRWTAASAASKANVIRILDEIQSQGLTLDRVWHAYRSGKVAFEESGKRLADAIEEVLEAKTAANRCPAYLTELRRYLRLFARGRESMDVGAFGVADIEAWFSERKEPPSSRVGNLGKLSALFDHCWRRGYIKENPCLRAQKPHVEIGVPKILSVDQCEGLMRAAEATDRRLLPELALGLFAGVRPNEIARLDWSRIDLERSLLTIDAAASKVRHRRLVNLHPTCVAWLRLGGDLPCALNRRRRMDALKAAASIRDWPHDVLRHTAASHLVALHGARTAAETLGHSETMLFKHYRELVTKREATLFWGILPADASAAT